ncbi:aldo/keto reductase [Altericroceibacterium spongiae]|uniref:Aldo/keto reductase n=1 Tax=Altericroceibacterium spongiae TaxID=2320269 RepID=A0A420EJE0_9SPHN|nr:aldo/keto reductase [Altericroceibacterium spongiae]RKF20676.1 aldo/keto reductase [Altericroceibacterium spongiae]
MKRTIAGTQVHPIGLGCMNVAWAYGSPPSEDDSIKLFNKALDLGYNHLDTANIYGKGKSEELIGKAVKSRRKEFFLASKTGIIVDGPKRGIDCSPKAMTQSIEDSLKRLQTDHIDLFYMHRFDPKVPIAESVGALKDAIDAGKIGAYGVSEWSSDHIRQAHAVYPMAAVQTEYSLWTRNVELGILDTTKELDIALVAFSPVARGAICGIMTDPSKLEEKDLRRSHPRFSEENWPHNLALVEKFVDLAQQAGITPAQLALQWVISRGDHIHAIPGTTKIEHMEDNFHALDRPVDADVLQRAGELINQQTVSGHRYPEVMRNTIDTEDFVNA